MIRAAQGLQGVEQNLPVRRRGAWATGANPDRKRGRLSALGMLTIGARRLRAGQGGYTLLHCTKSAVPILSNAPGDSRWSETG